MNKLSSRLISVASFVDEKDRGLIDIGCDHGLLSIFLAKKYDSLKIIASDINENALNGAISNIKKNGFENKIETRLGKGLDVLKKDDDIDTIVICGMGANTIVGMLKYSVEKLSKINKIIIQSNTDLYFLRKNVTGIGYYIEDEILVKDKGIIYTIILFKKGRKKYNYKELYLGPILIKKQDELFVEKNRKELDSLKMILKNIRDGHYLYKLRLKKKIKILESIFL